MKPMRFLVAGILGVLGGWGTIYVIGASGLTGEGGLVGGLYSALVIYPAALLVFAIVFWIVYAAMDPGTEQ
jgi:hypothetical protein